MPSYVVDLLVVIVCLVLLTSVATYNSTRALDYTSVAYRRWRLVATAGFVSSTLLLAYVGYILATKERSVTIVFIILVCATVLESGAKYFGYRRRKQEMVFRKRV